MTDIVHRLRGWLDSREAEKIVPLLNEAATEIERLRTALARIAEQDATFSVIGGNIIIDVEPFLSDEERLAIKTAIVYLKEDADFAGIAVDRATLINLLKRLS